MAKIPTLFLTAAVILAICYCQEAYSQTDINPYRLDTNDFKFHQLDQKPFLVLPDGIRIPIPQEWLYPPEEVKEDQESYVSAFNYMEPITSFAVGEDLVGLHLSSWDSMAPGSGSAMAAAGRDVFLVYNTKTRALSLGFPERRMEKNRCRSMGCFFSRFHNFIIGDINNDGLTDIGVTLEKIWCELRSDEEREIDYMAGPYYKKYLIEWFISKSDKWVKAGRYNGIRPKKGIRELPKIGLKKSPVEFVREICRDKIIEVK